MRSLKFRRKNCRFSLTVSKNPRIREIHRTLMRIFRHFLEISTNFGCHLLKNSNNTWETDKNFIKYIKSILGVMNQKLMPAEIFANSCLASSRCWRGNSTFSILFFALVRFIDIMKFIKFLNQFVELIEFITFIELVQFIQFVQVRVPLSGGNLLSALGSMCRDRCLQ